MSWKMAGHIFLLALSVETTSAQTFRVRAKPVPFGGTSNQATFFSNDTSILRQPEELPRKYAVILLNEYPWQVTNEGLLFGSGFDAEGNSYYFRTPNYGLDKAHRQSTSGASLYEINSLGVACGTGGIGYSNSNYAGYHPVIWKLDGQLQSLTPPTEPSETWRFLEILEELSDPSDLQSPVITTTPFDETYTHTLPSGGIGLTIDEDGTVYGAANHGHATVKYEKQGSHGGSQIYFRNDPWMAEKTNGYAWSGSAASLLGTDASVGTPNSPVALNKVNYPYFEQIDDFDPEGTPAEDTTTTIFQEDHTYYNEDYSEFRLVRDMPRVDGIRQYGLMNGNAIWNINRTTVEKARSGHLLIKTVVYQKGYKYIDTQWTLDGSPMNGNVNALNREGWAALPTSKLRRTNGTTIDTGPAYIQALNARHVTTVDADGNIGYRASPQLVGRFGVNLPRQYGEDYRASTTVGVLAEENLETGAYETFDLNQLASMPEGWWIEKPTDINDKGVITAIVVNTNTGESKGAVLLPMDIVPDFNRDGNIDDMDRGKITNEKPWRFWINDDDDSGDTSGDDIPSVPVAVYGGQGGSGSVGPDWVEVVEGLGRIDGTRDLVDFFPLWLDIKQLTQTLPTEQYSYYLKQADQALNFAYSNLKPDSQTKTEKAGAYLIDLTSAQSLKNSPTTHITAEGVQLTSSFINTIKNDGKGVILLEGRCSTTKPLVLEVRKLTGEVIATTSFAISIDGVEKMYRKWDLYNLGNPAVENGKSDGSGPQNYPDKYSSNKAFVIVHGYNVNPEAARGWGAEMFKRLFQTGSRAKFYNVRWYGYETQVGGSLTTNYQANINNAFAAAQNLAGLLSGVSNVTIAGHSLGNMLVSSAIQDWGASPQNYFMIDAAVAKQAYDGSEEDLSGGGQIGMEHPEWVPYAHRLWSAKWHMLFDASDNRSKLDWDDRLAAVANINTYNFYSTGEEVLHNPTSAPHLPLSANEVWNNQERMKGRFITGQVLSSNYGGWEFNPYYDLNSFYHMDPALANGISNTNLKVRPFFNPGPAELYGENGSAYASPSQHRNTLLAEMVPALSFAAGSNKLESFGDGGNFDMMTMKNGWPQERLNQNNPNWMHSDFKVVAYLYMHPVIAEFIELTELNQ